MKVNIFWAAPFVLPFLFAGTALLLCWFVGVPSEDIDRESLSAVSLFFGFVVGLMLIVFSFGTKWGEITIGKSK